jgi:hypothetical protein
MERDPYANPTANVYVGHVHVTRTAAGAPGKDGVTPRGVRRFAADSCVLENCQFRSGHDAAAAKAVFAAGPHKGMPKNPDPEDVLLYNCRITKTYAEHKRGGGRGRRIHLIGNTFEAPVWRPPIAVSQCADAVVRDNRCQGRPADLDRPPRRHAHRLRRVEQRRVLTDPEDAAVPRRQPARGRLARGGSGACGGRRARSRCAA